MADVVVVESPAKATTIEKYLGQNYKVVASYGHVRDLPKSKLGIDVEHNFEPEYIIPKGTGSRIKALKSTIKNAKTIYLGTDFDREGEAIAWHLLKAIPPNPKQKVARITFTEITRKAITDAMAHPRAIDQDLVDAQQARRVVDRLVGYSLSPILWQKIRSGLSAGRVQSVALRLIVDREREIQAFKSEEYWSLEALLATDQKAEFSSKLSKIKDQKAELKTKAQTDQIVSDVQKAKFSVASTDQKEVKRSPAPPFITSSLQQEASRKLGFSAKKTMMVAQQLYEGINIGRAHVGLISYMRTDSYQLSQEAITQVRELIGKQYGDKYLPTAPRVYKKKVRGAQEAHEAIRPTKLSRQPDELTKYLTPDQLRLYRLIWQRTLSSQMSDAQYRQIGADIKAGDYTFRSTGRLTLFDGFTKVYLEGKDHEEEEKDQSLPELKTGQPLDLAKLNPEQHFTSPPPRYTEATLIRTMEEKGIGRPSTYAPTISTLATRGYVQTEQRQLIPQEIGFTVNDVLAKHFPFVVSEDFTAEMEEKLDDIAEGQIEWQPVIRAFYEPFSRQIKTEAGKIAKVKAPVKPTNEICEVCGKPMVIKTGRFGEFMACSGWPECKNTKPLIKAIGMKCPEDGGEVIEKRTRRGKLFYGCSNYPKCKFASWENPQKSLAQS